MALLSPGQVRSQLALAAQLTEQEPVQVTWQVEPSLQLTLPLLPTVTSQVAPLPQSILHEAPQLPVHMLWSPQLSVQLSPEQLLPPRSQACPLGHEQLVPVHVGGGAVVWPLPPQPSGNIITRRPKKASFIMSHHNANSVGRQ